MPGTALEAQRQHTPSTTVNLRSPRVTAAATALLLLTAAGAFAQTFYVATDGVDAASGGSQQAPWATLGYATNNVPDGATIAVLPGTYTGRSRLNGQFTRGVTVRSSTPYQALLRGNAGAALICFTCSGVTVEGFDIAHTPGNTGGLVVQIQDLLGLVSGSDNGTDDVVSNVVLRNNIIHDSTNNDLLKINNGAERVTVEGNLFFNQAGSDEHIDINSVVGVVVQDNVFFNTTAQTETSSFIVVKDSNGTDDTVLGTRDTIIRRNVLLNWQGSSGQGFLRVGEDGTSNHEADGVLIENNLMLGNSSTLMRSALTIQGSRAVTFRSNTVVGNLPSRSYAARLLTGGANPVVEQIDLSNNIWSDPSGSMGSEALNAADLFEAAIGSIQDVSLQNNVYFNGGDAIPQDATQALSMLDDPNPLVGDPALPPTTGIVIPTWSGASFAGGQTTIREVFIDLVAAYGTPGPGSIATAMGEIGTSASDDILGQPRGPNPDIGAVQRDPATDDRMFADGFEN